MARELLKELKEKTDTLSIEENLELIDHLVHKIRAAHGGSASRRKWEEIRATGPYPLAGEDAQIWVKRTREESDSHRGSQWNRSK